MKQFDDNGLGVSEGIEGNSLWLYAVIQPYSVNLLFHGGLTFAADAATPGLRTPHV